MVLAISVFRTGHLEINLRPCLSSFRSEWSFHYEFEQKSSKQLLYFYYCEWWNGNFSITEYKIQKRSLTTLVISNVNISSHIDNIHCLSAQICWIDAFIWLLWSQGEWPFPRLETRAQTTDLRIMLLSTLHEILRKWCSRFQIQPMWRIYSNAFSGIWFCIFHLNFHEHTQRTSLIGFILQNTLIGQIWCDM